MKRIIFILIVFIISSGVVFAQSGDARVKALGGAFTAVADDLNSISMNPAGLGFLKHKNFVIGLDFNIEMKNKLVFGQEDLPYPYKNYDDDEYKYWNDFTQMDEFFDPMDYKEYNSEFIYDIGDAEGYAAAVETYINWREMYGFYQFADNTSNLFLIPQIAYVTKNWGVSTISNIGIDFILDTEYGYEGINTPIRVDVSKKQGLMGALGFRLGPVGLGANVKYYKLNNYSLNYQMGDFNYGPPETFMTDVFVGPQDDIEIVSEPVIEMGIGTIFTIGTLSAGAYLDNLLFFLSLDEDAAEVDFSGILDTLSIGLSWTPFDNKLQEKKQALNLIAALDLKNLGSETHRELAAGVELGLNLGRVIMLNTRAGYNQKVPGELATAFDELNPYLGTYSLGFGVKFLFMEINAALQFPSDMVFDPPTGERMPEDRLNQPFGTGFIDVRISF